MSGLHAIAAHKTDLIELVLICTDVGFGWIAKHFLFHTLHVTLHSITQINKHVTVNADGGFLMTDAMGPCPWTLHFCPTINCAGGAF